MPVVSRALVSDAVAGRLLDVTGATGFYGQYGRGLDGRVGVDVPTKSATDLRVQPYFIFFPAPGAPGEQPNLCLSDPDLTWSCQVTAAAGDIADLNALIDRIDAALTGWAPVVAGHRCGSLRTPSGLDVGPARTDQAVTPPRLYVPLQYQSQITA